MMQYSMTPDEIKAALKEGIKDWLDEQFTKFGKWSLTALTALIFTALIYFVLKMNGWVKQ